MWWNKDCGAPKMHYAVDLLTAHILFLLLQGPNMAFLLHACFYTVRPADMPIRPLVRQHANLPITPMQPHMLPTVIRPTADHIMYDRFIMYSNQSSS